MILVLADDFSGATEIAGIAYQFGLETTIITQFETLEQHDNQIDGKEVVVIDTNSRSKTAATAFNLHKLIAEKINRFSTKPLLFKKVDSVFRGHIVDEIIPLKNKLGINRILLLPANPLKGRKIINGRYFIENTPLHETPFGNDPHFPINTNIINELIQTNDDDLVHHHLASQHKLSKTGIMTGDQHTHDDIITFIAQTNNNDLICGGAEAFTVFLNKYVKQKPILNTINKKMVFDYHILVNGSTFFNKDERSFLVKSSIASLKIPEEVSNLVIDKWKSDVLYRLRLDKKVAIYVDKPILKEKANQYVIMISDLVNYLIENISPANSQIFLTGGETARKVINKMDITNLKVVNASHPGVVSIISQSNKNIIYTVKPGSYSWGETLFKNLN